MERLRQALSSVRRVAVDTESNSLYAYTERVCLIQISTDQADFLLDPLGIEDRSSLDFLSRIFADPSVEKVFHAAEYDVMVMRRDLDFQFASIFDTMIAARVLGWPNFGLSALLDEHFDLHLNKSQQRANWGERPLTPAMLSYAQVDVHFLLPLRDKIEHELEAAGRLEEANELFAEVCHAAWRGGGFNPEGFWNIPGARSLPPAGVSVLKELYLYREERAQRLDIPVFKVMNDALLVEVATARPGTMEDLRRRTAISQTQIRRCGREIVACVQRGQKAKPPRSTHKPNGIDELTMRRFEALHAWRKEKAAGRGVPSDIVISKDALWELATVAPRSIEQLGAMQSIGPWRRSAYGEEVLNVLASVDNGHDNQRLKE